MQRRRSPPSTSRASDDDGGVSNRLLFRRQKNKSRNCTAIAASAFAAVAVLSFIAVRPPPHLLPLASYMEAAADTADQNVGGENGRSQKRAATKDPEPALLSTLAKPPADVVCHKWDASTPSDPSAADEWWSAHYPTYEAAYDLDNATHLCFRRTFAADDPSSHRKHRFLNFLVANQFGAQTNCTNVHTKHMWSSGWGADFNNVADGLLYGLEQNRSFQITFEEHNFEKGWHYAALKDGSNPVCASRDMFCYFLPLGKCHPGTIDKKTFRARSFHDKEKVRWVKEYATRPRSWLRRRVADYIRTKAPPIETPCAAIHVRRSDVVLHNDYSRRYFSVEEYLSKMRKAHVDRHNVLLLTDDADAIDEATEFHPEYNWMYLNRVRHRGASGGWENQVPSGDPAHEVVVVLSLLRLVRQCDVFVHGTGAFSNLLYESMAASEERDSSTSGTEKRRRVVHRLRVDEGIEVHHRNNTQSIESLALELERRRKGEGEVDANGKPVKSKSRMAESHSSVHPRGRDSDQGCAPQNGVVVLNLLGRLGNSLFEVGFANLMAKELCWGVLYRNGWASPFLKPRARQCFPHALLPPPNLTLAESADLKLHPSPPWEGMGNGQDAHDVAGRWVSSLKSEGALLPCHHNKCDFTQDGTDQMLYRLRDPKSTYRALFLDAFFIHHGWIVRGGESETIKDLRRWMTPDASCCLSVPPEDAVVIHIRDFEMEPNEPLVSLLSGFYRNLLEQAGLADRPIWIVCQPESVDSELVRNITADFPSAVTVPRSKDQYDSFCTLTRAKTLVLSHKSTFSQFAALLADPAAEVHYPVFNLKPFLTIAVSSWRYHMVNESRDGVKALDVPVDSMSFRMDWETPPEVQIQEVGRNSMPKA